jgi:hypothetical protein
VGVEVVVDVGGAAQELGAALAEVGVGEVAVE